MKLQGNAILIEPDKLPERTPSGQIVVPKSSKELLPEWGTVIDAGPACKDVKKGMRIIFPRKQASVMTIDDKDYYWLNEHQLKYMR